MDPIRARLRAHTEQIVETPLLKSIKTNELDQSGWLEFGKQRYLAASTFEELLRIGVLGAQKIEDLDLIITLTTNLREEMGVDKDGATSPISSHKKWRRDFYTALGLSEEELDCAEPTDGTSEYLRKMEDLRRSESSLEIAGGIMMQEFSIPEEFRCIQKGRDLKFPEIFSFKEGDTPDEEREKRAARMYIDHHIIHDAKSHYPQLEKALSKYTVIPHCLGQIISGINIVGNARRDLYLTMMPYSK